MKKSSKLKKSTAGRYPSHIKEQCDLVLKKLTVDSADALIGLGSQQGNFPFPDIEKFIGEQAITKTNNIFLIVNEKDNIFPDLSPEIKNENSKDIVFCPK